MVPKPIFPSPAAARARESQFQLGQDKLVPSLHPELVARGCARSCVGSLGWWIAQAADGVQDAREHRVRQRRLGQLEDSVPVVAHEPGNGLNQTLAQRGQRPSVDSVRRRQRTQKIGQRVKLKADLGTSINRFGWFLDRRWLP